MTAKVIGILLLFSIILNVIFGIKAFSNKPLDEVDTEKGEIKSINLPFLSKRIFAENQNDMLINFIPLRTAMREYVESLPNNVGVYFEYLPSGTSIGVNDKMEMQLASLVKIPVVMGIYKEFEEGNLKKDDILTVTEKTIDKRFGTLWQKGAGHTLTLSEAINLSLQESDNTSSNLLLEKAPESIDIVFDSLDIERHPEHGGLVVTPKNYASILRSLYLSSYLKPESSNEILDILTKTKFNDKLPAGVPDDIKVAHKIGVYAKSTSQAIVYTDCGIVYVPNRPYLLCIAVESDEATARENIKLLSKMIYGYVVTVN